MAKLTFKNFITNIFSSNNNELFENKNTITCKVSLNGVITLQQLSVDSGDYDSILDFNKHFFKGLHDENELWFGTTGKNIYIIRGPMLKIKKLIDYAKKFKSRKAISNLINILESSISVKH